MSNREIDAAFSRYNLALDAISIPEAAQQALSEYIASRAALKAAIRADTLRNDPIVKGLVEALTAYEEATREVAGSERIEADRQRNADQ